MRARFLVDLEQHVFGLGTLNRLETSSPCFKQEAWVINTYTSYHKNYICVDFQCGWSFGPLRVARVIKGNGTGLSFDPS